jgi:hypothetical protein
MKRERIKNLSCASIDVKPIDYDWSDENHPYGEAWDFWEAGDCTKCGKYAVVSSSDETHSDVDDESECDGTIQANVDGPMNSYYYPLPGLVRDDALKIAHLPLCIVEVDGETGLALTGGGMDLSWEICEAFMLLGELPPLHFADLPGMAGRGTSERDRWIIAGCLQSCAVAVGWARSRAKRLRETAKHAREALQKKGKA